MFKSIVSPHDTMSKKREGILVDCLGKAGIRRCQQQRFPFVSPLIPTFRSAGNELPQGVAYPLSDPMADVLRWVGVLHELSEGRFSAHSFVAWRVMLAFYYSISFGLPS